MGLLNSLSKTISVMLQYRIPPQNISKMLRGQKYEPYGFVTRHPYIKYCTSISDLISKIIDIEIGDYSRCQVKPEGMSADHGSSSLSSAAVDAAISNALNGYPAETDDDESDDDFSPQFPNLREPEYSTGIQDEPNADGSLEGAGSDVFVHENAKDAAKNGEKLYDGSTCPTCSSTRMVRNGTCKVCLDCGTTTGCS